jgi:diguanylate cyclase (GGDEF)-like protein/PAS domain S-box-containing protein
MQLVQSPGNGFLNSIQIKFNSLQSRLIIAMLLITMLPIAIVGGIAYNSMFETIRAEKIRSVGQVADTKRDQLVMTLNQENSRAKHLLSDLNAACGGNAENSNQLCATKLISNYLAAEGAIGATLHRKGRNSLTVGASATRNSENIQFKAGQLAQFSKAGPQNGRDYFIAVAEKTPGVQLEISYSTSTLESIFFPYPKGLGTSGEAFLADGAGYFATRGRYPSVQGHNEPIAALPMQSCLSGQSSEMLALDYRDTKIIHGFRFVPEFGSACIMAHIAQNEAFAPMNALQRNIVTATSLSALLLVIVIVYLAHAIVKPIARLTKISKDIARGDYRNQADTAGFNEISELATSFNFMTDQLRCASERVGIEHARFRDIYDLAPISYCTVGETGLILQANLAAADLLGVPRSELIEQQLSRFIAHEDQDTYHLLLGQVLKSGELQKNELRMVRRDGAVLWIHLTATLAQDEGAPLLRVVLANISERKQTEALLHAQQAQIKLSALVFSQSREGITISDAQGVIVMANKAFAALSGYTEAELMGLNTRILSSGRHSREFYRAMWDSINTTDYWSGEIWDRRKDGTDFPVWLTISTLRDSQGRITNYLGNFSDLSDVKTAEDRIQWLSHFDHLTGLPNRALLQDRTEHAMSMVQRAGEPLTMMLLSIDHFKEITDTMGHHMGDKVLMEVARRLSACLRAQDTVARTGGKEFVLVLPSTSADGAAHVAAELLLALALPCPLDAHELTLSASIGIACYPENGGDFDAMFKAVEIARQHARANGRGSFQFYRDDMYQELLARDHMTRALRSAAARDQLELVYQPLVDLQTGQISGMEALLRWHHPELGSVSPATFIPLAEEAGLIKGIGEWVLRRACRDIRGWLDKGIKVPHVAVNVSPLQFRDNDFIAQVKSALADSQVDPKLIYLEVTETTLMHDAHRSEAMLKELKTLGIRLSLDDFGTGYSSLSYLKQFPFDKVKIDRSFVRDITTNQSDGVLVNVIVSMAHGLGMKVVAEGVETEAQCEIMRTSICDEIQGFFFSQPISVQAIEKLFSEGRQLPAHLLRLQKPQRTLLLVDDEPNIVAALKRLFRRDGHNILTANSGPEGLDLLSKHKVDIIISDQRMPGMTGVEFLRVAKANYPDTIRIVLSGYTELQSVTDAINEGAVYRFLTKPWEDEQLREHIRKAFEYKGLLEENRQLDIKIRTSNQELVAANRQLGEVLQNTRHQVARDEVSLTIMREALRHIPLAVMGVDDEGLLVFVNAAAQSLFTGAGPLLGTELAWVLPAINAGIAATAEGIPCELQIGDTRYRLVWHTMGESSRSRGKLVTLTQNGGTA